MNWRALIVSVAILGGQNRPDFTGHWELIRSAASDTSPFRVANAIDIADSGQVPRLLTVTRFFEGGDTETRDYRFGISGTAGGIGVSGGIPKALSFQSIKWDDGAIVIDEENGPDGDVHQRWAISAAGELLIESADKPLVLATEPVTIRYARR